MEKPRVLLTGATGYIAGQLLPAFREAFDLRLIDSRQETKAGEPVDGVTVVDLLDAPDHDLAPFFTDVDVVVHTAYHRPTGDGPQAQYDGERRNVDMMQRVYQLALDQGVRRVVAASTNQAAKWYEQPYFAGRRDRVSPEDYPRPDTFYGWAKAASPGTQRVLDVEQTAALLGDMATLLAAATRAEQRALIHQIIETAWITKEGIYALRPTPTFRLLVDVAARAHVDCMTPTGFEPVTFSSGG